MFHCMWFFERPIQSHRIVHDIMGKRMMSQTKRTQTLGMMRKKHTSMIVDDNIFHL